MGVMPSIIPGYEYDIFISYRKKDNEYDSRVANLSQCQKLNKVDNP